MKVISSRTLQTSHDDKMRFIPQIVIQKLSGIRLIKQSLPSEILHFIQKMVNGCASGIHSGMGEEMTNHLFFKIPIPMLEYIQWVTPLSVR